MSTCQDGSGQGGMVVQPVRPTVLALLILCSGVFVLQMLVPPFERFALGYLAMDTGDFLGRLRLWQAVTAIFLHADVSHILMNMLFLYFFGSALEEAWRRREFLTFFFVCGIAGSLCFYVFNRLLVSGSVKGLGASGAVFGLMAAYAMVYGNRIVLAFFILPMKAKWFVALCFAIELLALCGPVQDGIGHAAHVGGAVAGWAYLKLVWRRQRRQAGPSGTRASSKGRFDNLEY